LWTFGQLVLDSRRQTEASGGWSPVVAQRDKCSKQGEVHVPVSAELYL